jgi:predicted ester cyclase
LNKCHDVFPHPGETAITTAIMSETEPTKSDPGANAALIRRFYDEVFNRGNTAFADDVHGAGYRYHDITVLGPPVDHATYMARNAGFAAAFPDRKVQIEDLIATAGRVIARGVMHATHSGLLGDIAPTGRKVRLAFTIIYRFEQGRVVEEWEIFDKLGMYQQLKVTRPDA